MQTFLQKYSFKQTHITFTILFNRSRGRAIALWMQLGRPNLHSARLPQPRHWWCRCRDLYPWSHHLWKSLRFWRSNYESRSKNKGIWKPRKIIKTEDFYESQRKARWRGIRNFQATWGNDTSLTWVKGSKRERQARAWKVKSTWWRAQKKRIRRAKNPWWIE